MCVCVWVYIYLCYLTRHHAFSIKIIYFLKRLKHIKIGEKRKKEKKKFKCEFNHMMKKKVKYIA